MKGKHAFSTKKYFKTTTKQQFMFRVAITCIKAIYGVFNAPVSRSIL